MEFSETRRKVGRRNQGDSRDSTDLKSSEIASGVPSKTVPCSSRGTPNKRSFKANHGSKHVEITAGKLLCNILVLRLIFYKLNTFFDILLVVFYTEKSLPPKLSCKASYVSFVQQNYSYMICVFRTYPKNNNKNLSIRY